MLLLTITPTSLPFPITAGLQQGEQGRTSRLADGLVQAQTDTFVFAAGGDIGANSRADASLRAIPGTGADFFLALGDMDYDETSSDAAWCDYVTQRVGNTFPFELVTGNHEEGSASSPGPDGYIGNHAACLPDRMNSTALIPGRPGYPANYYFDYPQADPYMRVIMISANLRFDGVSYNFNRQEQTNYNVLATAIDQAHQGNLWVVVGVHKNCLTAGSKSCELGADLLNLLIEKRVDLVLQGHDHNYQRSRQLALSSGCTSVAPGSFNGNCVADDGADNVYTRGAGTVFVISGIVGRCCYTVSQSDSEAGYFARLIGNSSVTTAGFVTYTVSRTRIDVQTIASMGSWGDSFSLVASGSPTPPPSLTSAPSLTPSPLPTGSPTFAPTVSPTATRPPANSLTFAAAADSYVDASQASANFGTSTGLRADSSPVVNSYLRFDVQNVSGLVTSATLRLYANSALSGGLSVRAVTTSAWSETSITYNNAPSPGSVIGSVGSFSSGTWLSIDVTSLVSGNGLVSFAITSSNSTAVSLSSREGAQPPQLIVNSASGSEPTKTAVPTTSMPPTSTSTNISTQTSTAVPTLPPTPNILTFNPVADSFVSESRSNRNYGTDTALRTDGSPTVRSYLRFDLAGTSGSITSARLRLYATSSSNNPFEIRSVNDNSWGENTITYRNSPSMSSSFSASVPSFSSGTWVEVDVTSLVTGNGLVSLALTSSSGTAISFASRETAQQPQLVIQTGAGAAAAPPQGIAAVPTDTIPTPTMNSSLTPTFVPSPLPTDTAIPTEPAPAQSSTLVTVPSPNGLTTVESDASEVSQVQSWRVMQEPAGASGGSYLINSDSAGTLALHFGSSIIGVVYVLGPSFGQFTIEVDGNPAQLVNTNAPDYQLGQVIIGGLTEGEHEVKIVPTVGVVAIDAFLVSNPLSVTEMPVTSSATPTLSATPSPTMTLSIVALPFATTMDEGVSDWQVISGDWTLTPDAAYGGSGIGWQATAGNNAILRSAHQFDLRGVSNALLAFQMRLTGSGAPAMVQVSNDGVAWTTVAMISPLPDWQTVAIDLGTYTGQLVQLQILWFDPQVGNTLHFDELTIGVIEPATPTMLPTVDMSTPEVTMEAPIITSEPITPIIEVTIVVPSPTYTETSGIQPSDGSVTPTPSTP